MLGSCWVLSSDSDKMKVRAEKNIYCHTEIRLLCFDKQSVCDSIFPWRGTSFLSLWHFALNSCSSSPDLSSILCSEFWFLIFSVLIPPCATRQTELHHSLAPSAVCAPSDHCLFLFSWSGKWLTDLLYTLGSLMLRVGNYQCWWFFFFLSFELIFSWWLLCSSSWTMVQEPF